MPAIWRLERDRQSAVQVRHRRYPKVEAARPAPATVRCMRSRRSGGRVAQLCPGRLPARRCRGQTRARRRPAGPSCRLHSRCPGRPTGRQTPPTARGLASQSRAPVDQNPLRHSRSCHRAQACAESQPSGAGMAVVEGTLPQGLVLRRRAMEPTPPTGLQAASAATQPERLSGKRTPHCHGPLHHVHKAGAVRAKTGGRQLLEEGRRAPAAVFLQQARRPTSLHAHAWSLGLLTAVLRLHTAQVARGTGVWLADCCHLLTGHFCPNCCCCCHCHPKGSRMQSR
mmetsp:Transcript_40757/g.97445  ORF Transcript_40757/g.97445 Transcript_40757/m.97445 type:complete len:283 (+) Transcript_40757:2915-3763(+)